MWRSLNQRTGYIPSQLGPLGGAYKKPPLVSLPLFTTISSIPLLYLSTGLKMYSALYLLLAAALVVAGPSRLSRDSDTEPVLIERQLSSSSACATVRCYLRIQTSKN